MKVCLFFGVQYVFAMQINSLKLYLNKETLTVTPEVQAHQDTYKWESEWLSIGQGNR